MDSSLIDLLMILWIVLERVLFLIYLGLNLNEILNKNIKIENNNDNIEINMVNMQKKDINIVDDSSKNQILAESSKIDSDPLKLEDPTEDKSK